tara:strand:+ start:1590 stop:2312 length:723 start_codon:yes stop_codon:yes gene_type:complete
MGFRQGGVMKKIILGLILTMAWTLISLYGYIDLTNKIDTVSRQMYKIKEYQDGVKLYLNNLSEDSMAINNYVDYNQDMLNMEINKINNNLKDLNTLINNNNNSMYKEIENLKEDFVGVNAGLGVLTGTHVIGLPEEDIIPVDEPIIPVVIEEIPEPVIYSCPKLNRSVNFGDYITNIDFNRSVSAVIGYDIIVGSIENIQVIEGKASSKLIKAITKYLNDAIPTTDMTVTDCYIPFKIEV